MNARTRTMAAMVEEYQCPGCNHGPGPGSCPAFAEGKYGCENHVVGTGMFTSAGPIRFALGLPNGFNRPCPVDSETAQRVGSFIRLHPGTAPDGWWDQLNIAVWAMDHESDVVIRTVAPRTGLVWTDVVANATREELVPQAVDVADFHDRLDS